MGSSPQNLRPVQLVVHSGRILVRIGQDGAVGGDEGEAGSHLTAQDAESVLQFRRRFIGGTPAGEFPEEEGMRPEGGLDFLERVFPDSPKDK